MFPLRSKGRLLIRGRSSFIHEKGETARVASPRLASPRLAALRLASPCLASPRSLSDSSMYFVLSRRYFDSQMRFLQRFRRHVAYFPRKTIFLQSLRRVSNCGENIVRTAPPIDVAHIIFKEKVVFCRKQTENSFNHIVGLYNNVRLTTCGYYKMQIIMIFNNYIDLYNSLCESQRATQRLR